MESRPIMETDAVCMAENDVDRSHFKVFTGVVPLFSIVTRLCVQLWGCVFIYGVTDVFVVRDGRP